MNRLILMLVLVGAALSATAQTLDEALLSAQLNFQRAREAKDVMVSRVTQAEAEKKIAEQRLIAAQDAAQAAIQAVAEANAARFQAEAEFAEASRQLETAWQARNR